MEAVLTSATSHLGPDHPITLTARHGLACWLGRAGQVEEAISQLQVLLGDRPRVLGPDHPATLATRHRRAIVCPSVGRMDDAIAIEERRTSRR